MEKYSERCVPHHRSLGDPFGPPYREHFHCRFIHNNRYQCQNSDLKINEQERKELEKIWNCLETVFPNANLTLDFQSWWFMFFDPESNENLDLTTSILQDTCYHNAISISDLLAYIQSIEKVLTWLRVF